MAQLAVKRSAAILILMVSLSACVTNGPGQAIGTVLGGAGGAVAGAQFGQGTGRLAAVAIGTLAGAAVGSSIGNAVDISHRPQPPVQPVVQLSPSPSSWHSAPPRHYHHYGPRKPRVHVHHHHHYYGYR